jgi:hypothetical protein
MEQLGDYNLIGQPQNISVYGASGAGGDRTLLLEPPDGQVWIVKLLSGSHSGIVAVPMQWFLRDNVRAININGPYDAAVAAAPYEYLWPFATHCAGPLVLSSGACRVHLTMIGLAAGEDCYLKAHVHIVKGVWRLG